MRRFMVLVAAALLAAAMVAASAGGAQALGNSSGTVKVERTGSGVAVDPIVCETPAVIAPNIGWRNGTCWVFYPSVSASGF